MKVPAVNDEVKSFSGCLLDFEATQKALREAQANHREAEYDLKRLAMEQGHGHMLKLDPVAVKHALREIKGVR